MSNHRIVIVGATSYIAQSCAKIWVTNPEIDLTLVARDADKLAQVAADLKVRGETANIESIIADFLDPMSVKETVKQITEKGSVDLVLIAQGTLSKQVDYRSDLVLLAQSISVNALSPMFFAEEFATVFEKSDQGTIAIIGSVAGDRARKSNYIYGSGKNMLEFYCAGLKHRFAGSNVRIILIKPGPTNTPMTKNLGMCTKNLANVEDVAKGILKSIGKGKGVAYVPGRWRIVMFIVRNIPDFIFNRLSI